MRKAGSNQRKRPQALALLLPWCVILAMLGLFALEYTYLSNYHSSIAASQPEQPGSMDAKSRQVVQSSPKPAISHAERKELSQTEVALDNTNASKAYKLHPKLHKFVMMTYEKKHAKSFNQAMTEAKTNHHKSRREGKGGESAIAHLEGEHGGEWDW
jgi:hypothetical protein